MARHLPGLSTLAIHAGKKREAAAELKAQSALTVLEERLSALEGGTAAFAAPSFEMTRLILLQSLMQPGDNILIDRRLKDGQQFAGNAFAGFGWDFRWIGPEDIDGLTHHVDERSRVILVPSIDRNGRYSDVSAIAAFAREVRLPLVIDNTMATPYLIRPLEHGADLVLHDTSVFLGEPGGVLIDGGTFDWSDANRFPFLNEPLSEYGGSSLLGQFGNSAFAAACHHLARRTLGHFIDESFADVACSHLETLPLRVQRQSDTALAVASWLEAQMQVLHVDYGGLTAHPDHRLNVALSPAGSGAAFTVAFRDGASVTEALLRRLRIFSQSKQVGGNRSLVTPDLSSPPHASEEEAAADRRGDGSKMRFFIGLEDARDLIADLQKALAV